MKSKLVMLLTVLVCFLLQCTLISRIAVGSITPNLLITLCVSMGLMRGRKGGLWAGFLSGILVDLFYGSVFGFYAMVYMYTGYLCGYAHRIYYDDDLKVPMMLSAVADLAYNLAVYGLQFLLRGRLSLSVYMMRIILPEMFYTVGLTFLVYRPLRAVNYRFMGTPWKESDSIWVVK